MLGRLWVVVLFNVQLSVLSFFGLNFNAGFPGSVSLCTSICIWEHALYPIQSGFSWNSNLLLKLVLKIRAEHRLFRGNLWLVWPIFLFWISGRRVLLVNRKKYQIMVIIMIIKSLLKKWHVLPRLWACCGIQLCNFHCHINHLFNKQAAVN